MSLRDGTIARTRRRRGRAAGLGACYAIVVLANALVIAQQRCAGFLTLAQCSFSVKTCDFGGPPATLQNAHGERIHWLTRLLR